MPITQLDDFMPLMVKSASNNKASDSQVSKQNWWPCELALTNPTVVRGTPAVDVPNWRETLHQFVVKYSTFQKSARGRMSRRSSANNERSRRGQPRQERDNGKDEEPSKGEAATTACQNEMELGIRSNRNIGFRFSPVVSLCDILKLKPNDKVKDKSPPPLSKDQFMKYFELLSNSESSCTPVDKGEILKYSKSHPKTLVNCPAVPFSSNLGIKLTKEWHAIPPETHIRKLERLERYIRPNLFNIRHATDAPFEVVYNKNTNSDRIYKFPAKIHLGKEKLSRKGRFLLKQHCKPCTVSLIKLEHMHFANSSIVSETITNKQEIINEKNSQKENIEQKFIENLELRVVLTDELKENTVLYKSSSDNLAAQPLPSQNTTIPKTFVPRSICQQPTVRLRNSILKTLTPRNENLVGSTMVIKKPVELLTKCKNLINASVVLTPINDIFGLRRSVPESEKSRSDDVNSSINQKHNSKQSKVKKIEKKRVNIYRPRRISPRLNIIANTSPVKVM